MTARGDHCLQHEMDEPGDQQRHGHDPRNCSDRADLRLDPGADEQQGNHNADRQRRTCREHHRSLSQVAPPVQPIQLDLRARVELAKYDRSR